MIKQVNFKHDYNCTLLRYHYWWFSTFQ